MKPAEDWAKQIGAAIDRQDGYPLMQSEYSFIIKQIQTEAVREGMKRAAKMVIEATWKKGSMNFNQGFISGIISLTAEKLTEKDL